MPLLTDLAVMLGIDPLALVFGLMEFVMLVYGTVMSHAFPDVQVKAYRNSVLYVNLVSVVDCSVLNWVDFNSNFKCRMRGEDLSHVQFNPKLWNLRPVVTDSGEAMRVPVRSEAFAHVKENQQVWPARCRPLPDQFPRHPPIRRMLLEVTSPAIAPRIGAARDAEEKIQKWSKGMQPRFISWKVAAMHTFVFTFPDAWSRKKIKAPPSRKPGVSTVV